MITIKDELNRFFELCQKQLNNEDDDLGIEILAEYMEMVARNAKEEDAGGIEATCRGYEAMMAAEHNCIIILKRLPEHKESLI